MIKLILTQLLFLLTLSVSAQLTLSTSTGYSMKGGAIGYQISPKLNAYLGLKYMSGSATVTEKWREVQGSTVFNYEDENELSFKLFIPTLGVKYFWLSKNKVKAYATVNYSIPILSAEAIDDGDVEEELEELSSNNSSLGLELGIGGEYFFDDNFSVGAEMGYSKMTLSSQSTRSGTFSTTPITTWEEDDSYDFGLSRIYNRLTLNFYF